MTVSTNGHIIMWAGGGGGGGSGRSTFDSSPLTITLHTTMARKLTKQQEAYHREDIKKLLKAGLINDDLSLTDAGDDTLIDVLRDANMDKLVARADELLADRV
jgi:hypothetical protein